MRHRAITDFHHSCVNHRHKLFDRKAVCFMPSFDYRDALLCDPCLSPWYLYFSKKNLPRRRVYPPPSGRHAMRCLYGIGRDSWVWEMSSHALASMHSSHGVGEYSVTAVWPRAGGLSRRRPHEIIVAVVFVVVVVMVGAFVVIG